MKKTTKILIGATSATAVIGASLFGAVIGVHDKNQTKLNIEQNFNQTLEIVKNTSKNFALSQENKNKALLLFQNTKDQWEKNKDYKIAQQLSLDYLEIINDSILKNNPSLSYNDLLILKNLLVNLKTYINESSLKKEFEDVNNTNIDLFIKNYSNSNAEYTNEFLTNYYNSAKNLINELNTYLDPIFELIESTNNVASELEIPWIINLAQKLSNSLKNSVLQNEFSYNQVDLVKNELILLKSNLTSNKEEFIKKWNDIQTKVNKIKTSTDSFVQGPLKNYLSSFAKEFDFKIDNITSINEYKNLINQIDAVYSSVFNQNETIEEIQTNASSFVKLNQYYYDLSHGLKSLFEKLINSINNPNTKAQAALDYSQLLISTFSLKDLLSTKESILSSLDDQNLNESEKLHYSKKLNDFLEVDPNLSLIDNINKQNTELNQLLDEIEQRINSAKLLKNIAFIPSQIINSSFANEQVKLPLEVLNTQINEFINQANSQNFIDFFTFNQRVYDFNDQIQKISKKHLKDLFKLLDQSIYSLSKIPTYEQENEQLIEDYKKFNLTNKVFAKALNPISSIELYELITAYYSKIKFINLILSYQNALNSYKDATTILNNNFNKFNEVNYQYTPVEQSQIDSINAIKEQIENIKADQNKDDDQKIKEINDLNNSLLNIINNSKTISDISQTTNNIDEIIDKTDESALSEKVKDLLDQTKEKEKEVEELIKDPNVSSEQLNSALDQLNNLKDQIKQEVENQNIDEFLNRVLEQINKYYPLENTPKNEYELRLREYWDFLKQSLGKSDLTEAEKIQIKNLAQQLFSAVAIYKQIDESEKKLSKDIDEVQKLPYADSNVQTVKDLANQAIEHTHELINSSSQPTLNNLPSLEALEKAKSELQVIDSNIQSAYYKDKITIINNQIQENIPNLGENSIAQDLKNIINNIDVYAKAKLNNSAPAILKEGSNIIEKDKDLVDLLIQASNIQKDNLDLENQNFVRNFINAINNNFPNNSDSVSDLQNKINDSQKEIEKFNYSKELFETKNELDNILNADASKVRFQEIGFEIENIKTQINTILDSNAFSASEIQNKINETNNSINELKQQKQQIENDFNESVAQTQRIFDEFSSKKDPNIEYSNFDKLFEEFQDLKNSDAATKDKIDEIKNKIALEFEKDKAINNNQKLNDLIQNFSEEANADLQNPLIAAASFVKQMNEELQNNSFLTLDEAKDINEKITKFTKLLNDQKLVADKIKDLKQDQEQNQSDIEVLQNAIRDSIADAANNYTDLEQRDDKLLETYNSVVDLETKKQNNRQTLENIKQKVDQFSQNPNKDPVFIKDINALIDELTQENNEATVENIQQVFEKINNLTKNIDAINELADEAKVAQDYSKEVDSTQSSATNKFKTELDNKIKQAQNVYITGDATNEQISQIKEEIESLKQKLQTAEQIANIVKEAKDKLKDIQFYQIGSQIGIKYQQQMDKYLDWIQAQANNITDDQVYATNLLNLAKNAKLLVEQLSETSLVIKPWNDQPNFNGETIDAQTLINDMWVSVPKVPPLTNQNADSLLAENELVISNKKILNNQTSQQKIINQKRNQNNNQITQLKDWLTNNPVNIDDSSDSQTTGLIQNTYPNLFISVQNIISSLENENNTSLQIKYLEKVSSKIDFVNNIKQDFLRLASVVKSANDDSQKLSTANPKILRIQSNLNNQINLANNLYQDANTNAEIIEQQIQKVIFFQTQMNLSIEADNFQTTLNQSILSTPEKRAINSILNNFWSEFDSENNQTNDFKTIKIKYFGDSPNKDQGLLYELLNTSTQLRKMINYAEANYTNEAAGYNSFIDSPTDTNNYKKILDGIQNAISVNKNSAKTPQDKENEFQNLRTLVQALINSKFDDISIVKTQAQKIVDVISNPSNNLSTQYNQQKLESFKNNAIDVLDDSSFVGKNTFDFDNPDLIKNINEALYKSITLQRSTLSDIFNLKVSELQTTNSQLQNYKTLFIPVVAEINSSSPLNINIKTKYQELSNRLDTVLGLPIVNDSFDVDNFSGLNTEQSASFQDDILDSIATNITKNNIAINNFLIELNNDFVKYMSQNPENLGILVSYNNSLSPLFVANEEDKNLTFFQKYGLIDSYNFYVNNGIRTLISQLTSNIVTIDFPTSDSSINKSATNTTQAAVVAPLASQINQTALLISEFIKISNTEINKIIAQKSSLNNIFNEIFDLSELNKNTAKNIVINELNNMYSNSQNTGVYNLANIEAKNIPNTNEQILSNSGVNTYNSALSKFKTFVEWPYKKEQTDKLISFIDQNINLTQEQLQQYRLNNNIKAYQVITPKNGVTREKFVVLFNSLVKEITPKKTDSSQEASAVDLSFDITTNKAILELFDEFAFTEKDPLFVSPYNMFNVKTSIVYNSQTGRWFQSENITTQDPISKDLTFKIRYKYTPSNLSNFSNFPELVVEKDVTINFPTLDTIQLPDGSSSIFFKLDEQGQNYVFGHNTQTSVLNVIEAGWYNRDELEALYQEDGTIEASKLNELRQSISAKAYNKFKEVVLDGQNEKIISSDEANYYKFKFSTQSTYTFDDYIGGAFKNDTQQIKIIADDASQQIMFLEIVGGEPIGSPGISFGNSTRKFNSVTIDKDHQIAGVKYVRDGETGSSDPNLSSQIYIELLNPLPPTPYGDGDQTNNYSQVFYNRFLSMPLANVNLISFKFDIITPNQKTNDSLQLMMYLSNYENLVVSKNRSLSDPQYNSPAQKKDLDLLIKTLSFTDTTLIDNSTADDYARAWTPANFAKYLVNNSDLVFSTNRDQGKYLIAYSDFSPWDANKASIQKYNQSSQIGYNKIYPFYTKSQTKDNPALYYNDPGQLNSDSNTANLNNNDFIKATIFNSGIINFFFKTRK
ncbi:hypothetical protein V2E24_02210 [Mycoplasmopsis ciconiae]|uniref:Uncharacterized protein n=1 Tax=Mycoplasmopsis ciconiae TaxID=561067 RepID=A0ABU7MLH1_9BACT|nr:hypothetical protein [Mycoplasmopsis ciconiae]